MSILPRRVFKTIEHYLYNYAELKKKVREEEEEIIYRSRNDAVGVIEKQPFASDPTAAKAMKLVSTELEEKRKWLRVVEKTAERYRGTAKGLLLQRKYFEKRNEIQICRELFIDRSTYYNWRKEIVLYAALVAVQEGVITVQ